MGVTNAIQWTALRGIHTSPLLAGSSTKGFSL